jgi:hypothetical protein
MPPIPGCCGGIPGASGIVIGVRPGGGTPCGGAPGGGMFGSCICGFGCGMVGCGVCGGGDAMFIKALVMASR